MKKWILATRPWSLPASVMPALVALAYVFFHKDVFSSPDWPAGIAALIGAAIFHLAGNLISDYFDYKKGVDSIDNIGQTNLTIINGVLSAKQVLMFGFILLIIGAAIGFLLVFRCGLPLLYIGIIGTALTVFYYLLKSTALGDLDIFITFGLLIALGTCYVTTGELHWPVLAVSSASGLLIVGILHANNTRDRKNDNRAGITTFAMLLGLCGSKIFYTALLIGAYLIVATDIVLGLLPLTSAIVLLSLPIAIKNIRAMLRCKEMTEIAALDGQSAQLVMIFSLLVAASCFIAPLI